MRLRPDEARITISLISGGRYIVGWHSATHWHTILTSLKRAFPEHGDDGLLFEPAPRKQWSLPCWRRSDIEHWLAANFESPCVTWTTGSTSDHTPCTDPARDAYGALYLTPNAPLWAAEAVYRAGQKRVHPDTGGSHSQAAALNRAIAVLRNRDTRGAHTGAQ